MMAEMIDRMEREDVLPLVARPKATHRPVAS